MTYTQIIRGYLRIAGLYTLSASLIWSINTLFLLEAGLNIGEVFISISAGYVLGGALTIICLPLLWALRRMGSDADRISGAVPQPSVETSA